MGKRLNQEEFILLSNKVHNYKYDYSKFEYTGIIKKGIIICPIHGEFNQIASAHIRGHGCVQCGRLTASKNKTKSKKEFIKKVEKIHNFKYDYSKTNYINRTKKIIITCPIHGDFLKSPNKHLAGEGCQKCSKKFRYKTKEFIEKARKIHGEKYDYSKTKYSRGKDKITIICPEHGEFYQSPGKHLQKQGCPQCAGKLSKSTKVFIQQASIVHNNKYDYSKTVYINNKSKITIICPDHGEFKQTPSAHLNNKQGCIMCAGTWHFSKKDFLKRATEKHGNKYDYSKVEYINCKKEVLIICPFHGEFWQTPVTHTKGSGCKQCNVVGGYSFEFFRKFPKKKYKQAIIYIIKIENKDLQFYKIGITIKSIKQRFNHLKNCGFNYSIIYISQGKLYNLFCLEQKILKEIIPNNLKGKINIKGGESECFVADENLIQEIIDHIQI